MDRVAPRRRFFGLTFKIPLFVLMLLLTSIWSLAAFIDYALKHHLERLLYSQQTRVAAMVAADIDREVRFRVEILSKLAQVVSQQPLIVANPAQFQTLLKNDHTISKLFDYELQVISTDDTAPTQTERFTDSPHIHATLTQQTAVAGIKVSAQPNVAPTLAVTVPITDTPGQIIGALVGRMRLNGQDFMDQIIATHGQESGEILVVDPFDERIIAATGANRAFQTIPIAALTHEPKHHLTSFSFDGGAAAAKIESLYSTHRIPSTGWVALVTQPAAKAFAPVAEIRQSLWNATLLLSALIPLLIISIVNYWLQPLRETAIALREMSIGQRALDILPVTTLDEIGQLIGSFNQLHCRIRESEQLLHEHHEHLETALETAQMQFIEWPLMEGEEPVAVTLLALVHPEDRERVAQDMADDMATHGKFLTEFRASGADQCKYFMARGQMVGQGDNRQIIAIVWDSTEFKAAKLAFYESEERFEAIIDSLNDAVFVYDENGAIVFSNARASEIYGYQHQVLSHLDIGELCDCNNLAEWLKTLRESTNDPHTRCESVSFDSELKQIPGSDKSTSDSQKGRMAQTIIQALQNKPQFFECRAKNATGRLFWVDVYIRVAIIGGDQRIVTVIRDIDDRKTAEDDLQKSEERYRTILDLSPEAIFVHHDGVMVMANRATLQLFGTEHEQELLGLPWTSRVHLDFHDTVRQRLRTIYESDDPVVLPAMEQRYLRVDGSAVDIEATSSTIILPEGRAMLTIAHDISQRKMNEAKLKDLLAQQEALLDNALVGIVLTQNCAIIQCNRRFEELFGYDEDELLNCSIQTIYPTVTEYEQLGERVHSVLKQGKAYTEELWLRRKDGEIFWGGLHGRAVEPQHPYEGSVWIYTDLSEQRRAQEHQRLTVSVFENAAEGIMITDIHETLIAVNRAFTEITGYTADEVIGKKPNLLGSGRHFATFYKGMWQVIKQEGRWRGELWNRRKNGEIYPEILSISTVRDTEGEITHYVGIFFDISAQKHVEEQLAFLAHHDPLTGLYNRTFFQNQLVDCIQYAEQACTNLAVLFIDLDHFKEINDTLGHHFGDRLLRLVADEFREIPPQGATLARLGGDEFILLIEDIESDFDAIVAARGLLEIFKQPFLLDEREFYLSASIGISFYPDNGKDFNALIKHADTAMYRAKAEGRNKYCLYSQDMTDGVEEKLHLQSLLRRSVENGELVVYFQPQVDMSSGALVGAEALVRWQHPEHGLISPAKFIPLAEENGYISVIGEWVLRESCRAIKSWRDSGYKIPQVSINLSIKQLESGDVVGMVKAILKEFELPPECLEIEITESFIADAEEAIRFLSGLRELGIQLSVDDFGTGYSSLMYLKQLPVHKFKIDRSFVMDIGRDVNSDAIVRTIIALARNLGMSVIAEGVETAKQRAFLLSEGCTYGQGYHFDKPLPEKEFIEQWLAFHDYAI